MKSEGMRSMRVKESTSSACSGSANVLQGSAAGEGTEGLAAGEVIGTGSRCAGISSSWSLASRADSFAEMMAPMASWTRQSCSERIRRISSSEMSANPIILTEVRPSSRAVENTSAIPYACSSALLRSSPQRLCNPPAS